MACAAGDCGLFFGNRRRPLACVCSWRGACLACAHASGHRAGIRAARAHCLWRAGGDARACSDSGHAPGGVFTPILVHQFLARGYLPGTRAIVYGDSRYATATARRLADAGVEVTQITPATSEGGYSEGQAELVEVLGFPRVEGVRLRREGQVFDLA